MAHTCTCTSKLSVDYHPLSLMHCRFDMYTCIKEEDTLFTKYRPTRGMNIDIYNYLKHNICLTLTKTAIYIP
jgi:hypothetical protein